MGDTGLQDSELRELPAFVGDADGTEQFVCDTFYQRHEHRSITNGHWD